MSKKIFIGNIADLETLNFSCSKFRKPSQRCAQNFFYVGRNFDVLIMLHYFPTSPNPPPRKPACLLFLSLPIEMYAEICPHVFGGVVQHLFSVHTLAHSPCRYHIIQHSLRQILPTEKCASF